MYEDEQANRDSVALAERMGVTTGGHLNMDPEQWSACCKRSKATGNPSPSELTSCIGLITWFSLTYSNLHGFRIHQGGQLDSAGYNYIEMCRRDIQSCKGHILQYRPMAMGCTLHQESKALVKLRVQVICDSFIHDIIFFCSAACS